MEHRNLLNLFPDGTREHISLLRYSKTSCGVDFLLNTADSSEKRGWFDTDKRYKTDFFEFYFFRKAAGRLLLSGRPVDLHDETVLIISPYQQQEWQVQIDRLDYTFLVFQEEFLNQFLSDKYFIYRLQYCYQYDYPVCFPMAAEQMERFLAMLREIRTELRSPVADSYHLIVACLYRFLLLLNRFYTNHFGLPTTLPVNNYAYQYKQLLEANIRRKVRVNDYADMLGISRVSLNRAVTEVFGVSAAHLLKRRLLQEVKDELLFGELPVKEIAFRLNFSEPNHLMRFFKQQTGQTISQFLDEAMPGGKRHERQ